MCSARVTALLRSLPFVLAVLLAGSGCDTSVTLFDDEEAGPYSVFGILDAAADTQFVRIEPLRDSTFAGGTDALKARVFAENIETGEILPWQDSVFALAAAGGVAVRNAWTTAAFAPGAAYRFVVERREEGAQTTAEVTLPERFPVPEVVGSPDLDLPPDQRGPILVLVEGVERLGGVRVEYVYEACVPTPDGENCYDHSSTAYPLDDTTRTAAGAYRIEVAWQQDIPVDASAILRTLYSFRVTVASVSEDWPTYAPGLAPGEEAAEQPLPPPGINSNVENGAGFLGGAFTRTVDVPIRE